MPKHRITFNAHQIIDKFMDEGDIADQIIEYAPDHGFPATAETDSIGFCEVTYDPQGNATFVFDYDEEPEDDEDEE